MKSPRTVGRIAVLVLACCACLILSLVWRGGVRPPILPALSQEGRREDVLERHEEAFRRFDAAKQMAAAEVAAGRVSLAEAVDQFRRLNQELKESPDAPSGATLLPEDDEAVSRNVLARVGTALRTDPGRAVAVLGRLGGEFRERFGHSPTPAIRFTGGTLIFTVNGHMRLKLQGMELKIQ